jgi:hypothetical protein
MLRSTSVPCLGRSLRRGAGLCPSKSEDSLSELKACIETFGGLAQKVPPLTICQVMNTCPTLRWLKAGPCQCLPKELRVGDSLKRAYLDTIMSIDTRDCSWNIENNRSTKTDNMCVFKNSSDKSKLNSRRNYDWVKHEEYRLPAESFMYSLLI